MNVEIKEAGDARKVALVTFDSEEVSEQENQVCREFGRMANVPGFRKGKAPPQVIRKRYSKEMQEALNRTAMREQQACARRSCVVDAATLRNNSLGAATGLLTLLHPARKVEMKMEPLEIRGHCRLEVGL